VSAVEKNLMVITTIILALATLVLLLYLTETLGPTPSFG
jgi:uncharacterized protein YoxC